jgi:hypothetical protein
MLKKLTNALDIYGQPIVVNYKGESSYKTKIGALISLITIGFGLAYAVITIMQMATRENTNVQTLTKTLDLFYKTEIFNLADQKIEFIAAI